MWYHVVKYKYDRNRSYWLGHHDTLYEDLERKTDKLKTYASHFPIVELDASYYAIQPERNIIKWINETPNRFQLLLKFIKH